MFSFRSPGRFRRASSLLLSCLLLLTVVTACSSGGSSGKTSNAQSPLAAEQVLKYPNVGISDPASLDPALIADENTRLIASMLYSGLVRLDKNLNVLPDQATWDISPDGKTYTFHLKSGVRFSDGSPVTAGDYLYSWSRALWPELQAPHASLLEIIEGSEAVVTGKTKELSGVRALDAHTLQVTLVRPAPYFLSALTNCVFMPVNKKLIERYGQQKWSLHVAGEAVGTGPLRVKQWFHNVKMVFEPNPFYYGKKTQLKQVDMLFINDPVVALKAFRAGQYSFIWKISQGDQNNARVIKGFTSASLAQTSLLFFDTTKPPFDNKAVRQAFAYALDKQGLSASMWKNAAIPAPTIVPPGIPGYQPDATGIPYGPTKAKSLLQTVYPDVTKFPDVTFSYPSAQMTSGEAGTLRKMWREALGINVELHAMETMAYNQEVRQHQVQLGFTQWRADFPDPYDWLYTNLCSSSPMSEGLWKNAEFDRLVKEAETRTGNERLALYQQAERLAIEEAGWLPLGHHTQAAIIPSWLKGVSLNAAGLYFGDWSEVALLQH